jgi:hypothetical protein
MFKRHQSFSRQAAGAAAAVAIVAFAGLTFDQAHLSATPAGTVVIGELTPIGLDKLAQVTLPEVIVSAHRAVQFAGTSPAAAGTQG